LLQHHYLRPVCNDISKDFKIKRRSTFRHV